MCTWPGVDGAPDGQLDRQDGVAVAVADAVAAAVEGAHVVDHGAGADELAGRGGAGRVDRRGLRQRLLLLLFGRVRAVVLLRGVCRRGGILLLGGGGLRGGPEVLGDGPVLHGRRRRLRGRGVLLRLLLGRRGLGRSGILLLLGGRRILLLLRGCGVLCLLGGSGVLLLLGGKLVRRGRRRRRGRRGRAGLGRRSVGPAGLVGGRGSRVRELGLGRGRRHGRRRVALLACIETTPVSIT